jgi:hypothetical protein
MSDERAPCPICQSTFRGLCAALDAVRSEAAELRVEQYRRGVDCTPIAERARSQTSATIRELRLELADAQRRTDTYATSLRRNVRARTPPRKHLGAATVWRSRGRGAPERTVPRLGV